jgi:hypothetical protein
MVYNLGEAAQWLKGNKLELYYNVFIETYKYQKWENSQELAEYLKHIEENTVEWYKNTPKKYKSIKSLEKIKTGINHLLKSNNIIIQIYGESNSKHLIKKMGDILKNNKEEIIKYKNEEREIVLEDDNIILTEDDISSEDEEDEEDISGIISKLSEEIIKNVISNEIEDTVVIKKPNEIDWEKKYKKMLKINKIYEIFINNKINKEDVNIMNEIIKIMV